ncbi:MAG: 50S ribosomal protein L11 methyltransferase [Zoogloeaceae bacterium]|jgi:ribosomal protein L11 methyltransferase|nr:50S ribosomal protein L11 methyltransferase [Zoogloeaceae bacterium]
MAWIHVTFPVEGANEKRLDAWSDALFAAGALSVGLEDADAGTQEEMPQFGEPGQEMRFWKRSLLSALFLATAEVRKCVEKASRALCEPVPALVCQRVEEENWVRLTQAQFTPIQISPRLWIVPSWCERPDSSAICLTLDPGMAFGTGAHPTTRLCLEWLEREVTAGASVLDYGCGSGILAIAAGKLGASRIMGVDIDPQAVLSARENARINSVAAIFTESVGARTARDEYDLVVANILANPLRALAAAIAAYVRPGGRLALSGLLREQAEEMRSIYAPWISLDVFGEREGWVCLAGQKRGENL